MLVDGVLLIAGGLAEVVAVSGIFVGTDVVTIDGVADREDCATTGAVVVVVVVVVEVVILVLVFIVGIDVIIGGVFSYCAAVCVSGIISPTGIGVGPVGLILL